MGLDAVMCVAVILLAADLRYWLVVQLQEEGEESKESGGPKLRTQIEGDQGDGTS